MAFKTWNSDHLAKFNSAVSCEFLESYESYVDEQIREHEEAPSSKTFSGSSFRCDRKSWFRLRGTEPDKVKLPDKTLNFTAEIGTACHRIIQNNLAELLQEAWLDVDDFMKETDYEYEVIKDDDSLESQVHIFNPPIKFACDGLIKLNGIVYLLEIKTSEFGSWNDLTGPKLQHIDQVKCYASLLNIHNVLFLYQDRQYGGLKCYEVHVTDADMIGIKNRFDYVLDMVKKNLAPEGLPQGDTWCTSSMCAYYNKCQEYGR